MLARGLNVLITTTLVGRTDEGGRHNSGMMTPSEARRGTVSRPVLKPSEYNSAIPNDRDHAYNRRRSQSTRDGAAHAS